MNFAMNNDIDNLSQQSRDSKQRTLKWLQSAYLSDDSGIVTGQRSSVCGKDDDMETDIFDQISQEHMSGVNQHFTQSQPPVDMLPELMVEDSFNMVPASPASVKAAAQQGSKPESILNHMDESIDPECALVAIPELISLLNDDDQVVVYQAVLTVLQSSQREASWHAIMNSPEVVAALVRVVCNNHDSETTKKTVSVLHNLSQHKQGLLAIFRSGGIAPLVKLLGVDSVLFYAITTLHNLLLHVDGSKSHVRAAGGVQKMVLLLRKDNLKFLTVVTDCLHLLTYGNQESKQVMLHCNGPVELIRIIQTYNYEKLLLTSIRVLKVLSVCSSNKQAIVAAGGMQALGIHLNYPNCMNLRLVQTVLWTLRNLSDAATKVNGLEELLQSLVYLLQASDEHVVTCAAGILSNLTCNNQQNKVTICQAGGVEALIRTIVNAGDKEEIIEPSICALRHLTSKPSESEMAQNEIRMNNGIQVIVNLFRPSSRWPLIKAVIGLIRNLAQCRENHTLLREQGAVHHLVRLLMHAFQDTQIKNNGGQGGICIDGVRMEEIIEGTVGALHALARDPQNRSIILSQQVTPVFAELLLGDNENIQRVAAGVLCELTPP